MKKTIRLTESDLTKLVKRIIIEQNRPTIDDLNKIKTAQYRGGGEGTQGDRDIVKGGFRDIAKDFTIPGGMFINGVDKIDINSPEFKDALNKIKNTFTTNTKGKVDIEVQGGASKVGYERGYDNESLANRRRDNFINAIKKSLGGLSDRFNFIPKEGKVGQATIKNSPEANAEQWVKITYPDKLSVYTQKLVTGKESTDVAQGITGGESSKTSVVPDPDIITKGNPYMIVKVYYKKGQKESYKKKILESTGSPVRELTDYQAAKDCGLKFQ